MELYLIRHGEMKGDPHRGYEPPVEGCLSELGCRQAMALQRSLDHVKFAAIYSSPLGRAIQTAQSIAHQSASSIRLAPWLIEWRPATVLGTCDEASYPGVEAAVARMRPEECWKTAAGEGTLEMAQRIILGFNSVMASHGVRPGHGGYVLENAEAHQQRIALVAHGGSLASLLGFLLGVPIRPFAPFSFSLTAVAVVKLVLRVDVWYPTLMIPNPQTSVSL